MLQANKANVITWFHLKSLDIRNAELQYFLMVFSRMEEIASFLGGSASAALTIDIPKGEDVIATKAFYLFMTSSAFGLKKFSIIS